MTGIIYTRMGEEELGGRHGTANQLAGPEERAEVRGRTVAHCLSDNDILDAQLTQTHQLSCYSFRSFWL